MNADRKFQAIHKTLKSYKKNKLRADVKILQSSPIIAYSPHVCWKYRLESESLGKLLFPGEINMG